MRSNDLLALVSAALDELDAKEKPRERIEALIIQARTKFSLMDSGGVEALREAHEILEGRRSQATPRVLEMLARRTMLSGDVQQGIEFSQQAVEAAALATTRSRRTRGSHSAPAWLPPAKEEGLAAFEQVATCAATRTLLRFYQPSDALNHVGRYDDAARQALSGVDVAGELGLERSLGAMLAGNAAEPLLALGEWTRASAMIERALELDPRTIMLTAAAPAWLHVWRGQLDEADAVLAEFRPLITNEQLSPQYNSQAIRTDAEHALAVGDHQRAWSDVKVFFDHWELYERTQCYPVLAVGAAARVLDEREGTGERLALVRHFFDHRSMHVRIRQFWEPMIIAELDDTAEAWRSAFDQLAAQPAPAHLRPYAGLRLGQHLVAGRERVEAKEVLATASRCRRARLDPAGRSDFSARAACRFRGRSVDEGESGGRPDATRTRGAATGGSRPVQWRDRLRPVYQYQDGQRACLQHLGQARVSGRGEAAALAHRVGLTLP